MHTESLLDIDPDLLPDAAPEDFERVRTIAQVPCVTVPAGSWDTSELSDVAYLGIVIVSGRFAAQVGVGGRQHVEVLGPGDVGQPWVPGDTPAAAPTETNWRVLQEARVAVLDRRFAHLVTPVWPMLARALMERLVLRSRRLLFQLAVLSTPQISERIELVMWHFADRWGRVAPDGVLLELPLSHELLSQVVSAQRPSVTTALGELRRRGRLERREDGCWLLSGEPPQALVPLYEQTGLAIHTATSSVPPVPHAAL